MYYPVTRNPGRAERKESKKDGKFVILTSDTCGACTQFIRSREDRIVTNTLNQYSIGEGDLCVSRKLQDLNYRAEQITYVPCIFWVPPENLSDFQRGDISTIQSLAIRPVYGVPISEIVEWANGKLTLL